MKLSTEDKELMRMALRSYKREHQLVIDSNPTVTDNDRKLLQYEIDQADKLLERISK